jgi:hypothetical protein
MVLNKTPSGDPQERFLPVEDSKTKSVGDNAKELTQTTL